MTKTSQWTALVLVLFATGAFASPAAAGPVNIFVEDLKIELDGWDARQAEALGKALATDLQGAIVKNAAFRPMTFENLESQLRKEKRAEQLSCTTGDQSCIQKILDNYGCEERLYGTVRQVGDQAQVNLTRYRNEQLVEGGAASAYAKVSAPDITATATRLARELFGLAGSGQGTGTTFGGGTVKQGVTVDRGESIVNVPTDDTGFLTVTSEPSGAALSLNGKEVGTTPKTLEPKVGHYVLVADLGRLYHPARQEVDLTTAGAEVALELEPAFGSLEVTSEPSGADVWLDGEKVGTTPYMKAQKPSGSYELRVVRDNYLSWKGSVTVSDGKTTRQPVKLDANFGALEVSSEPAGAVITLDGQETGLTTPHTFDVLERGVHTVTLSLDGYGDAVERATVQTDSTARVAPALQAKLGTLSVVVAYDDGSLCRGKVFLDGQPIGTTPLKVQVTAIEHEVKVTCEPGEHVERVRVEHNRRKSLDWKIARERVLAIAVEDDDDNGATVDVWVDGERVGTSPWVGKLTVGQHSVSVRARDGRRQERQITVNEKSDKETILLPINTSMRNMLQRNNLECEKIGEWGAWPWFSDTIMLIVPPLDAITWYSGGADKYVDIYIGYLATRIVIGYGGLIAGAYAAGSPKSSEVLRGIGIAGSLVGILSIFGSPWLWRYLAKERSREACYGVNQARCNRGIGHEDYSVRVNEIYPTIIDSENRRAIGVGLSVGF